MGRMGFGRGARACPSGRAAWPSRRLTGLGSVPLLVVGLLAFAVAGHVGDVRRAPATGRLYLVTLGGPGQAGYRGPLPAGLPVGAAREPGRRARPGRRRRPRLPVDDRAQRVRRRAHARAGRAAGRRRARSRSWRGTASARWPAPPVPRRGPRRGRTRPRGGAGAWSDWSTPASGPTARCSPRPVPGLGRPAADFAGECAPATAGRADTCNRKLVGARWFVAGFGEDNVRSSRRSRRSTTAGTAPRWPPWPPATPGCP